MRGLNAMWVNFILKKLKNWNFISLFVFVYPPSLTPCILIYLIYLYINPSDLTLPQITWKSPSFQSTPYLSKNIIWCVEPIIFIIVN